MWSTPLLAMAVASAVAASPLEAQQSGQPVDVEFRVGSDTIRGRFFPSAASTPLATLVLVPGFGGHPSDVLELGGRLSARDVNVLMFNNRGVQNSGGTLTYRNALDDAGAAVAWLRAPGQRTRFNVDPARVILGGHSFGGAIAILHAARDTNVRGVLSIAGADHSTYARRFREEPGYRDVLLGVLANARAPQSTVRLDPNGLIEDIIANDSAYSHPRHAQSFARRPVLLVGGWNDLVCPVERELLPMYRALRAVPGSDATLIAYPDGHSFSASREQLANDVHAWLERTMAPEAPKP
jgi:alpha-beta hydrolase superfamily lysophospholipase